MSGLVFDYDDGGVINPISDSMGIDSDGDLHMRISDNMSMDMDTGEIHLTSGWHNSFNDDDD